MSERLLQVLTELGSNSELQANFIADPEAFLDQQALADDEKQAILGNQLNALESMLGNSEILCVHITVPDEQEEDEETDEDPDKGSKKLSSAGLAS